MSGGNDDTFYNLLASGWNPSNPGSSSNPNAGSSSIPNPLGLSSQEMYQQHQAFLYWQQQNQQNTLNSNFQNLQFTQQSQQSQTETHDVADTPTSPPKKGKGRIKRKSKKSKDPEPEPVDSDEGDVVVHSRWTPAEEALLARCYIAVSEDPKVGKCQPKDTFWYRVRNEFNKNNYQRRNKDMLSSKWKTLNGICTKFNSHYNRSKRDQRSGESELDVMQRAKQWYREETKGSAFGLEDAWEVLRHYKKWNTPEPVDLTGEVPSQTNEDLFGQDEQPRPMGKKRATKKARSETTTSTGGTSTGGTSSSAYFTETMANEFRMKREVSEAAYRAAQEKDLTITRLEEIKFLMTPTAGQDPMVVQWINDEKDRIIKKYNLKPRE